MNLKMRGIKLLKNKLVLGFSIYDFANSAYILIINSYLFPIFLKGEVFNNSDKGDYFWGLSISASVLIAMVISPIIGRIADNNARRSCLITLILLTFCGMIALSFISPTYSFVIVIAYIFTNTCYTTSLAIYDSLLPHISDAETRTEVSSLSWGLGYLGGIICFAVVFATQNIFHFSSQNAFLITGVFYFVFSLFSVNFLPASIINTKAETLNFRKFRVLFPKYLILLLIALWLINDALDTVINFTSLFGKDSLHLSVTTIGIMLLGVQAIAIPATILMGKLAKRIGERKVIIASIVVWLLICSMALFPINTMLMIVIAVLTAFVIGTTSSLLRAFYANCIDEKHSSFAFGLYSIVTRSSSLLGPLTFGIISSTSHSQRLAILSIIAPLLIGGILFTNVSRRFIP
jgi:UMF1 family MFS transporter